VKNEKEEEEEEEVEEGQESSLIYEGDFISQYNYHGQFFCSEMSKRLLLQSGHPPKTVDKILPLAMLREEGNIF
jgi:hypothetical protein